MPDRLSIPVHPCLTKILATLGPATDDDATLLKLVESGASIFRLNFSHANFQDHEKRLQEVRRVSRDVQVPLAILADLPGPKIRINAVPDPGIALKVGEDVLLRCGEQPARAGSPTILTCNYPRLAAEVVPGHRVLIADGMIRMLAVETQGSDLLCRVTVGGMVTSKKGLNLPDSKLTVPALTQRDLECVAWAVEHNVDYIALSFVRRESDIMDLRAHLAQLCTAAVCGTGLDAENEPRIPIIAKIETPQAVSNIDEIVQVSDGIMVARGDLGVEMDVAHVPVVQKRIIRASQAYGKPCIVATQMLESMIEHATPTRAEVSDVANAIIDGADAVMLSGETAVGKYPALAVETMRRVAMATEEQLRSEPWAARPPARLQERRERVPALAHGAWHMARDVDAKVLVVWSQDGAAARYLSRNNFHIPILGFTSDPHAVRRMCLLRGVIPILREHVPEHRSDFAADAERLVRTMGLARLGDPAVLLAGKPLDDPRTTNTVAIRYMGELLGELVEQPART